MRIDKGRVIAALEERGELRLVSQAQATLPTVVDTETDAEALRALGLDGLALEQFADGSADLP
jgi:hypothetical protein